MKKYDFLIKMIKIASALDESNKYFLSDKLIKIAQEFKNPIAAPNDPALYSKLLNNIKNKLVQKYKVLKDQPDIKAKLEGELKNIIFEEYYDDVHSNLTPEQESALNDQLKRIIEQLSNATLTNLSEENQLLKSLLEKYGLDFNKFKNNENNLLELNQKITAAIEGLDNFIKSKYPTMSAENKIKLKDTLTKQLINTRDMYSNRAVTQKGGNEKLGNPTEIPGSQAFKSTDTVGKPYLSDERYQLWRNQNDYSYDLLDTGDPKLIDKQLDQFKLTNNQKLTDKEIEKLKVTENKQSEVISLSGGNSIFIYCIDKPLKDIVDEINKKIGPNYLQFEDNTIKELKLTIPGVNFSIQNLKSQLLVYIQDKLYQNNSKNPYNDFQFAFEDANLQDIINNYNKKFNYQLNVWDSLKDKKITINSTGSPSTILNEILRLSDSKLIDMHDIYRSYPDASYYIIPADYLRKAWAQNSKA